MNEITTKHIEVTLPHFNGNALFRTYYVTRVYTNGSGQRWCEAYFYNEGGKYRQVQNWARLQELARIVGGTWK